MLWKLLSRRQIKDLLLGAVLMVVAAGLLAWPQESMSAVRDGLTLCYNVIIPSLFPFFVLSTLVVELGLASYAGRALEGIMYPLFRVNGACASALALGFIGGYPVGARTAIDLYQKGLCTKTEAERLLAFCNNSGPAFILGVVGAGVFASSKVGVLLYLAHAAASVCVGLLFRFYPGDGGRGKGRASQIEAKRFSAAFTDSVKGALTATLNICAFVVLFTVVIRLLTRSGLLPFLAESLGGLLAPAGFSNEWAGRLLTGLLEVSSGVSSLMGEGGLTGRVSMAAFMLGWAGISVHCQVLSFMAGSGLSCRTYLVGKTLHGGLSALFVWLLAGAAALEEPVSVYLAEQVEGIVGVDFTTALTLSVGAAWAFFLAIFALAACWVRKTSGKRKKNVV